VSWADPFVIIPGGLLALLVLARLARLRPGLRPLVGPFALFVLVISGLTLFAGGPLPASPWLALLFLLPLLTLVVRGNVIAFQWLFHRRHGSVPPSLLDSVISVAFYGVGLGAVAHYWFKLELTPFLATSAVVGAVVGLALQDTLGNLFAGIALHTEAPFRVGDWVRVADRDGRIEQVSWRAMRLRTWDGDTLTIPNNEVSRHAMLNYSVPLAPHSRLILVHIGYETPPNRAIGVLRGALAQVDGMAAGVSPSIRIVGYHDWAMRYEIRYFFGSYEDYRVIEGDIYRLVWYHLRRAGIEFAMPISNVVVQQNLAAPRAEDAADRVLSALRGIDLFHLLSDAELHTVASRLRPQHYAAGEKIIEEGAAGDSLFLVDRGEVRVLRRLGGAPREIARLGEGECFGEMAMLTGQQRTATVVAGTDVDVFMIDKAGFQDILAGNPDMAVDISALLAKRRAALHDAEADVTTRIRTGAGAADGDLSQKILDRIRSYFGL
jgi:small-conductance mechanosensitive channel/CRP-like cAMP-binding protein